MKSIPWWYWVVGVLVVAMAVGGGVVAGNEAGRPGFNATRAAERSQKLEEVGARLRAMMPFLDAVEVTPDGDVKRVAEKPVGVR